MAPPADTLRADKWLWAARLYRTRSLAAKDCQGGKVKRGGKPLKPSAALRPGDRLEVPSPDGTHLRSIEVVQLLGKRVSAPLARLAYLDHTAAETLAAARERKKILRQDRLLRQEGDQGRMTKKKTPRLEKRPPPLQRRSLGRDPSSGSLLYQVHRITKTTARSTERHSADCPYHRPTRYIGHR